MAIYFMLAEVLPRAKSLAAFFAGILHAPSVRVFRGAPASNVEADEPLCYPDQATVFAERLYIEICIIIEI